MTNTRKKRAQDAPPFDPTPPAAASPVAAVTQSMELTVVQTAVANMNRVNEGLATLQKKYGNAVFDCSTEEGMAEAKAARKEIAGPRIEVEKIRVAAKRPILDLGSKLDSEAKRIKEALEAIEKPIDAQITAEENRVREEQEQLAREEAQRVSAIQERIAVIRDTPRLASLCLTSREIHQKLEALVGVNVDDSFAEFADIASETLNQAILQVRAQYAAAREREAEQARLAEQRAELDRRAAEQAERDRNAAALAEAERARVAALMEDIAELRGNQSLTATSGSDLIAGHIFDVTNLPVTEEKFGAYVQQARDAQQAGLARLRTLHLSALQHEAEVKRQAEAREQLEAQERERQRVDEINARMNVFNDALTRGLRLNTSEAIDKLMGEVEAIAVDATFAEFEPQAEKLKAGTLSILKESYGAFFAREEETRQRAEDARAEEEERDRIQREREAEEAAKQTEEAQRFEREGPPRLDDESEAKLAAVDFAVTPHTDPAVVARITWYMRRWAKVLQITTLVGP